MKILMVMAHPDDEIIFGWPILQDSLIEKQILCCSSDRHNEERKWCSHRGDVFKDICKYMGINCRCLDYNSEFYKMETRKESLSHMQADIIENIKSFEFDYIFTHNPLGEYGHLDHKMVFDIVCNSNIDKPVIYTDISLKSNWPSYDSIPSKCRDLFYQRAWSTECDVNEALYSFVEGKYRKAKVWTWSMGRVNKCGLYLA